MDLFVFLCLNYFDVPIIVRKKQEEALLVLTVCIYVSTSFGLPDLASMQQKTEHQCQSSIDIAIHRRMKKTLISGCDDQMVIFLVVLVKYGHHSGTGILKELQIIDSLKNARGK